MNLREEIELKVTDAICQGVLKHSGDLVKSNDMTAFAEEIAKAVAAGLKQFRQSIDK